ncbi:S1C family serine protease [Aquisphaera giovannonii]|uniref:S1C family serine protease n=1 Tax=Aquisphaera giovannonii TaxID=406548 RepID=UPI001FEBF939|nr:trypsin-like peptidase domain-containing protein [Aquisphaera giovannonii]
MRTVAAHALTAAVTLGLVAAFFGPRLALRGQATKSARTEPVPEVSYAQFPGAGPDDRGSSRDVPPLPIPEANAQPPGKPEDILKELDPEERNNVQVYATVNKSVVNITTESEGVGFFGDETSSGSGSGFVIDRQGHVMTNFHVIQGAGAVRVTLFDGSTHPAKVIGQDASNDVAILLVNVPKDKLFPVTFGDSSRVLVGQKIMALGNPFGLERTLTTGIVSSLDRSLKAKNGRMIKGIIQTDAAINPGNSGGPLLNARGQVIGMNTAIVSQVGQSAGISFAVPINAITRILKALIEDGRVIRGDLGIARVYATGEGLLVMQLVQGGPAEEAGIQPAQVRQERLGMGFVRRYLDTDSADLIVAIEHRRVRTVDELLNEVEKNRPGTAVRVTVVRDGKPMDISVTLGES